MSCPLRGGVPAPAISSHVPPLLPNGPTSQPSSRFDGPGVITRDKSRFHCITVRQRTIVVATPSAPLTQLCTLAGGDGNRQLLRAAGTDLIRFDLGDRATTRLST